MFIIRKTNHGKNHEIKIEDQNQEGMMKQSEKQWKFLMMLTDLIAFVANYDNYQYSMTGGDLWSKKEYLAHSKNSFHYKRLAIDLNLFIDGVYQESTEAHRPFGEYWESISGTWGGRFKNPDGNHYSLGEKR